MLMQVQDISNIVKMHNYIFRAGTIMCGVFYIAVRRKNENIGFEKNLC
jgi:hypothetical protein